MSSSTAMQSLRPLVDRLRRGWRASPLPGFFGWWAGELRGMLPSRWHGWFDSGANWHLLQYAGTQWTLRRAGYSAVLARWDDSAEASAIDTGTGQAAMNAVLQKVDRDDLRLALLLPSATVLRRALALPVAARDNLQQVMAFEMDRQTPFSMAQVYYGARDLRGPATGGRFNAELVVVTRGMLDPLLVRLHTLGVSIDAVDLAVGNERLGVNLLPPEQTPRHVRPRQRLNLALAATCVLLLALMLGLWLHNRQAALAQMQTEVEDMRGEAQQVGSLRQQLQDNAGAAGFLVQRKKNTVTMLSLLQDATTRLPDSAWLERFSVDNTGQIGMQGQSLQAAKLLDVLKDSTLITQASFQGSIQPDPTSGKERFYLTAQLRQPNVGQAKLAAAASTNAGGTP
jgi:general secretion pathway protein L